MTPAPHDREAVRRAAGDIPDLGSLAARVRTCTACPELAATRRQVVPGVRLLPTHHPWAALRGGPAGEPRRLLAEDLATAVRLAGAAR